MDTILLPGYSPRNADWANDMAAALPNVAIHPWAHWTTGGAMDARQEAAAILDRIGSGRVNLLAKSVGSRVAARIAAGHPERVGRLVLCGIPGTTAEIAAQYAAAVRALGPERILVIQNTDDPYAVYADVKRMFAGIDPGVTVLERPGDEHHYPYPEDFGRFLSE